MAKRAAKGKRAARKNGAAAPEFVKAKINVRTPDDAPTYYANHFEITHNEHEFALTAAKLPTKLTVDMVQVAQETGQINIEGMLQVVFPPTLINGLIKALNSQKDAYERENGRLRNSEEQGS